MTKHWLRGILLGVSLALLLASGVAVAQGLSLTADKDCVECWPGPYNVEPPDEYVVNIIVDGVVEGETYCENLYLNGESLHNGPMCGPAIAVPPQPYTYPFFFVPCDIQNNIDSRLVSALGSEIQLEAIEDLYGEWKYLGWEAGTDNRSAAVWLFADVCEAEFVPEPGTMVLLGSGLAGLAGYATLRLRSRRAFR